jgi:uncharacterized protein (TIGR01244 family)
MKSFLILIIISLSTLCYSQCNPISSYSDSVEIFDEWEDLFRFQTYYISAQPELENLEWLKEQGITKVINLRTDKENKEFSKESFNEKRSLKKIGLEYISLPINGSDDYTPEKLDHLIEEINPSEKVLIHCRSGGRATHFLMAYLIKAENMDVNDVVDIGKQIRFSLPFETILGVKVIMEIEEQRP